MAKYSTGSGGGDDDGDACELCGHETSSLQRATVAGAVPAALVFGYAFGGFRAVLAVLGG